MRSVEVVAFLQNDYLRVEFDEKGSLVRFVDRLCGRNYIASVRDMEAPLFRLVCVEAKDDGDILPGEFYLTSLLADSVDITTEAGKMRLRFTNIDNKPINVVCHVDLEKDRPFSRWRIEVENGTHHAIRAVEYPMVLGVFQLGESAHDDRILIPKHDGHLVGNPKLRAWEADEELKDHQRYFYPGEGKQVPGGASAQLLAYYDPDGGLYIATHDGDGHPKQLGPVWRKNAHGDVFDLTPVHWKPEIVGEGYRSPYDTVIGCFQGDWQAAADIYKEWAVQQSWCARTIAERSDIPDWVKQGAFFFNFRLRYQKDNEEFLSKVADFVELWGRELNIPMVAMMCGWEKIGEWTGPDYFPPYGGDERFQAMCEDLKSRGIYPFPFGLSGLKLIIRNKINASGVQPELATDYNAWKQFEEKYRPHAAVKPGGEVILNSTVDSWDGLHAYACVNTEQAREQLYDASMKLAKHYGAQVVQADQLFNGGSTECYHRSHGHPPGRGRWQVEALREIYQDIRREGKEHESNFVLSQEWQSELYLQDMDIYHTRNYDQPRGLMGVPLFAYLYHEYQPSYGGDWSSFLPDNTNGVYYHGANLVNGNLPAGCPSTMWKTTKNYQPEDADPRILQMAKNACRLFRRYPEYLVLGKMLNTLPLQVPFIKIDFVGVIFGFAKGPLSVPAVLCRAWQAESKGISYALANVSGEVQRFSLRVMPYDITGPVDLVLDINGTQTEVVALDVELPYVLDLCLDPEDVALLEIASRSDT